METPHYVDDSFVFVSLLSHLVEHILIAMTKYVISFKITFDINEKNLLVRKLVWWVRYYWEVI